MIPSLYFTAYNSGEKLGPKADQLHIPLLEYLEPTSNSGNCWCNLLALFLLFFQSLTKQIISFLQHIISMKIHFNRATGP